MNQVLFNLSSTKYFGIYRGQVINNVDPDQAGRCQIAIGPMFLGIAATTPADLPWAFPAMPLMFGSGVGYGAMNIPAEKSWVYCFFLEGDVYQPVYCFEAPTLTQGIPASILPSYPTAQGATSPTGVGVLIDNGSANVVAPTATVSNNLSVGTGATGTFITFDGQIVMVSKGIVIAII